MSDPAGGSAPHIPPNPEPARRWYRPMHARQPGERHRTATVLELFFDLCFVVAVAQAASRLHHDLSAGHLGDGLDSYLLVFFAIWWAWMNFTWFASAYDCDDGPYRLATFVQITGALILAAGVPRAFEAGDLTVITLGYVVMRLAGVSQWLRAAATDLARRRTALRYAAGVTAVQTGWLLRLALPEDWLLAATLLLIAAELLVPVWAERVEPTTWHPHHIAERYGLFTIIVLGESVLAATVAVQSALDAGEAAVELLVLAGAGAVIVYAMWWLYFDRPGHGLLTSVRAAFLWGYGHYLIFASVAAVGAGMAVAVDHQTDHAELSTAGAGYALAVPVAVFLAGVRLLHARVAPGGRRTLAYLLATALVLATPLTPVPAPVGIAAVLAALVAVALAAVPAGQLPGPGGTARPGGAE